MSKELVAYFSASKITEKVAIKLSNAINSELFEIQPVLTYTNADLNWMNKKSRSSVEMNNPKSRPEIKSTVQDMDKYDVIYLGFPIWWYVAPTIINTFLESYDFSEKTIVLFATSGGSGFGKTAAALQKSLPSNTKVIEGKVFSPDVSKEELYRWTKSLF